ncbi:MAG: asparagine synthase (glutamine-hydrolyzing) [Kiritimatiellae bacterium]|nr:asparagine synthase (glutamine-hydrolyzing) [Kiritimatiellia bacterium]
MCGICGIVFADRARTAPASVLDAMTAQMVHRGPDESGTYVHGGVGFGHRRLRVIDLETGRQPLSNEDESVWITYNGEIYNYRDLAGRLEGLGHRFRTRTDTEVVLHAYEQWGEACVSYLRGMFAFAIHDQATGQVFAARDRLGIKPFYYYEGEDVFVFGSEIKALLGSGYVERKTDPAAIESFVAVGYVPGPKTMFLGVRKLMPGHCLVRQAGRSRVRRYWDFDAVPPSAGDADSLVDRFHEKLRESVRIHLVSDVPLGVFLSGGVDSSTVVALMRALGGERIQTFSVGYRDAPESDELRYAKRVADRFHTEHHAFILEPEDFIESARLMVRFAEEPIVEPAAVALYRLAECAKPFMTVALSGEGADELLAGYRLYQTACRLHAVRRAVPPIGPLARTLRRWCTRREKWLKYLDWLASDPESAYRGTSYDATPSVRRRMLAHDGPGWAGPYFDDAYRALFDRIRHADLLSRLLYVDTKTWLADDLLVKADKMTMAASVELRVPFLDHELLELAAGLPSRLKARRGQGKIALRRVARQYLPAEILDRPKQGFPVPIGRWFRRDLAATVAGILQSPEWRARGFVRQEYVDWILTEHARSRQDVSRRLMSFLVLELWHREFIDRPPACPRAAAVSIS